MNLTFLTSNFYRYQNVSVRLGELYRLIKKRPEKTKIKASVIVQMENGPLVKLVFVGNRNCRGWLALLSTDTDLPDVQVIRIYEKRWDIEVFFKMAKHHLNLEREVQLRGYDGLVAPTSLVFTCYMFLALQQRFHDDTRSIGSLFHACCDEIQDLTLLEALHRLLSLALENVRKSGEFAEALINAMLDAVMGAAVDIIKSAHRSFVASV